MLSTPSRRVITSTTILQPGESWFSKPSSSSVKVTPPSVVTVVTRVVRQHKALAPSAPTSVASTATTSMAQQQQYSKGRHVASLSTSSMSSLSSLSSASSHDASSNKRKLDAPPIKTTNGATATKKRRVEAKPAITVTTTPKVGAAKQKKRVTSDEQPRRARSKPTIHMPYEKIYRYSRSRSTTAFDQSDVVRERKTWCDEDGAIGAALVSSEMVVRCLMHSYKSYFRNLYDSTDTTFDPHPTKYPFVDLEYPNDNASERFILLEPKDKDHYNPIMCLEQSLHTIVQYYLTPEQKSLFGTLPEESLNSSEKTISSPPVSFSNCSSPLSSPPSSRSSCTSELTALSSDSSPEPAPLTYSPTPSTNLLRSLNRAIHLRDGPSFVATMKRINELLRGLKCGGKREGDGDRSSNSSNPLRAVPRSWSKTGIPQKVIGRIIEEVYQRCIGPDVEALKQYTAFSSEVYGELMPSLTSEILRETGLTSVSNPGEGEGKIFVDLGSGVGNVVLQAALQSGCKAYGVEILGSPAALADEQRKQLQLRCRMWGVQMGEAKLFNADMLACPELDEILGKADVVLVNNYVFKEELNAALRSKFLDLKEGAIVVSLKPFAPPSDSQRLTERNLDDIALAIFDVCARKYHSGTVSWSSGSGHYYLHRVDREGYREAFMQYERAQSVGRRKSVRR